jgi:hypothetical protein
LGLKDKDNIPRLVSGKYLKELYELHERKNTLDVSLQDLPNLCKNCGNPELCKKWATTGKLTCFCLESIF